MKDIKLNGLTMNRRSFLATAAAAAAVLIVHIKRKQVLRFGAEEERLEVIQKVDTLTLSCSCIAGALIGAERGRDLKEAMECGVAAATACLKSETPVGGMRLEAALELLRSMPRAKQLI